MTTNEPRTQGKSFPEDRPRITVAPLGNERFEVDCRELKWWSIIPVVGSRASSAEYNPPDWRVALVRDMAAVRKAFIHDIEGVEIEVRTWETGLGWRDSSHSFFGRIKDNAVQWLGAMYRNGNETQVQTFLDEGFAWAFPDISRKLKDDGLFQSHLDGSLRTTRERRDCEWSGAGCFSVVVAERTHRCLRVIGLEGPIDDEKTAATEVFVSDAGRTILIRHYCRPSAAEPLGLILDHDLHLTIDGVVFMHWCDTVTSAALTTGQPPRIETTDPETADTTDVTDREPVATVDVKMLAMSCAP